MATPAGENRIDAIQKEEVDVSVHQDEISRVATYETNNYHGLNLPTVLVIMSLCLIAFTQLLNIVGAGAFARNIAEDIGGSTKTTWLSQVLVIVSSILGPPISQASDLWGRKWFLVGLTGCGAVGAIITSRATSMNMAIAGQVVCGLAFGAQPLIFAVPSEILPRRYRPAAQGLLNASNGIGGIVGILAGSALVKNYHEGWRIFWYLITGVLALAALICALLYNPPPTKLQNAMPLREKLGRLDWIAYFLLATGIVLFTVALSWSQNPYPWTDAHILAPFVLGIFFLIALVVHQKWVKKDGLIHHGLFRKDRNFVLCLWIIFVDGMIFFAANNYFSYEVSVLYETDLIRVGLRFCIVFFTSMVSSLACAVYSSMTRTVREPIAASFVLFVIFYALMATANLNSSVGIWCYPVLLGTGIGFSLTSLVAAAQLSAPPELIAITTGLLIAIRSLGASISLAIYTAVFSSGLAKHLGKDIAAAVVPLGLSPEELPAFIGALTTGNQKALVAIPGVTPQIIGAGVVGLKTGYQQSFQGVWIAAAVLGGVALIASLFLINPKKDFNMHVDAPLVKDE